MNVKLGKKAAKFDKRTLRLAKYFKLDLPAAPASVDWTKGITSWGVMKNDELGDCTCAAIAHAVQVWTANTGSEVTISDDVVLQTYSKFCGYDPNDPNTDQGGAELDVLNQWRSNPVDGHKLLAFADPDPKDAEHVKQAINLFGGVYIGVGLPMTAHNQFFANQPWTVIGDVQTDYECLPNSWGGHAVFVCAYDENGLTCITWGQLQKMDWTFWQAYCDEAHALLGEDWLNANKAPNGFDYEELNEDLQDVTG